MNTLFPSAKGLAGSQEKRPVAFPRQPDSALSRRAYFPYVVFINIRSSVSPSRVNSSCMALIGPTMASHRTVLASRLRLLVLAVAFVLVAVAALRDRVTSRRSLHDEAEEECESSPIADPLNLQEKWQAGLYGLGFLYICLGIAMICEEYFVVALNELIEAKGISPDVAGATFMAAGSSSPEVCAA